MDKKMVITIIAVCSAVCFLLGAGMFFLIDAITDSKIEDALGASVTSPSVVASESETDASQPTEMPAQEATEKATEKPAQKAPAKPKENRIIPYVGRYYDSYNVSYIEVTSVGDDCFIFNGFWYRAASVENAKASYLGNKASFEDNYMQGTITFKDKNTMEVTIDSTSMPGPSLAGTSTTFKYQGQDDQNQAQTDSYLKIMTGWSGMKGFVKDSSEENVLIRFYSDGSVKYGIGKNVQTGYRFQTYTDTYRVETTGNKKSVLYIGSDAYDITDMYAPSGMMSIEARGSYANNLSGKYIMSNNDMFAEY